jgi:antitoxin ParD1/3/4
MGKSHSLRLAKIAKHAKYPAIFKRTLMPTRNISLTPEQDEFIEKVVKSGEYQNDSEAMRDALRALLQRRREDTLKLKALRAHVKAGVEALERGEFTEVADADLDHYLENLTSAAGKRAR